MEKNMQLAVNKALTELQMARARMGLRNGGAIDAKRPLAWCSYGWPEDVSFDMLYGLYSRGGLAHGAVNKLLDKCWSTNPQVIQGEEKDDSENFTPWELSLKPTLRRNKLWREFKEADRYRLVGRYSAILLHIADNKAWDQPVTSRAKLVATTPAWASTLRPTEYDQDPASARYGQPKLWQYKETLPGNITNQRTIHPDRIFILGEWRTGCIGFLEPAYNAFVNLEKVEGGSGESFLKNASRQLAINFDKEVNLSAIAQAHKVDISELQSVFDEVTKEINMGNDSTIVTQGATTTPLVTAVSDPAPTYSINLQTVSAALDIPSKILVGMQTGERASTEDQKYFDARCQGRRLDLSDDIESFFSHLIRIRAVLPQEKFTVIWDDLTNASRAEKLGEAKTMSEINTAALSNGGPIFTDNEIRVAAGYEVMPGMDDLGEGGPGEPEDDEEDEPAQGAAQ